MDATAALTLEQRFPEVFRRGSLKLLMPLWRRASWPLPVCTNTLTLALSRCGREMATTRTPLPSVATRVSPGSRAEVMGRALWP